MRLFKEYIEDLNESRIKTHGVSYVQRTLPRHFYVLDLKFELHINKESGDFQLYFYNNGKFDEKSIDSVMRNCEILGYFPSTIIIYSQFTERYLFKEFKEYTHQKQVIENDKIEIDFIEFLRTVEIDKNFKGILFQMESWQDSDIKISDIPDVLYHVCRKIDISDIKKYGLYPKSKNKISFHPDRVYLTTNLKDARYMIDKFNDISSSENVIVEIEMDDDIKSYLKLKNDPNFDGAYYTNQNISKYHVKEIVK